MEELLVLWCFQFVEQLSSQQINLWQSITEILLCRLGTEIVISKGGKGEESELEIIWNLFAEQLEPNNEP